jgi:hypothetical protein
MLGKNVSDCCRRRCLVRRLAASSKACSVVLLVKGSRRTQPRKAFGCRLSSFISSVPMLLTAKVMLNIRKSGVVQILEFLGACFGKNRSRHDCMIHASKLAARV